MNITPQTAQTHRFERYLDIRGPELGRVLVMSSYLLLIITAYSITKAVRDSLFVARIGPAQLPYAYLLIAGAMGLVSVLHARAVRRISLYRLIRLTSLLSVVTFLGFWAVSRHNSSISYYLLYVWASVFGAITASQFWLLATHVFNPREARRLFPWIGIGGILGGTLGGGLTHRLAHSLGTESLLLVCAAMMTASLMLLERICRGRDFATCCNSAARESNDPTKTPVFSEIRQSRYATVIMVLLAAAVMVEAVVDYEYKAVASHAFVSKDQLTAFFGSITFYTGIFSLLFQLLASHRILKRFGVGCAILLLPIGLFASFLTLAAHPSLWAAAALQLIDGGIGYSIHRSGMELLYLPIAPKTRNAIKGFIDMFVDRMGRAASALLLLLCTAVLTMSISAVSLVGGALTIVWIAMTVVARREYLHAFRKALQKKTIEPEALNLQEAGNTTLETVVRLLSSSDERQVLYALDLLSDVHPDRWRTDLRRLAHHESPAVCARTIAILAEWNHELILQGEFNRHPVEETARIAVACSLRVKWTDSDADRRALSGLLRDSSFAVVREAFITAGTVQYEDAVPQLIASLSRKSLRSHARQALSQFDNVIPELVRHMCDPLERPQVRKRIPKVLAITVKQEAATALMSHLGSAEYFLKHSILRALNKMRIASPQIALDHSVVNAALIDERGRYDRLMGVYVWLQSNPIEQQSFPLLLRTLEERFDGCREHMIRLLALIYEPNDLYSAYFNYRMKPWLRPAAIEFLDNIVDAKLKNTVIPALEQASGWSPEPDLQQTVRFDSTAKVLSIVSSADDPWLQTIAVAYFAPSSGENFSMSKEAAGLSPVDKVLCLQHVDIFKHATTEMLAYIGSIAQEVEVACGHVIFSQDEISDAMYVVSAGRVRLDKAGTEILTVTAGQSFGGWALVDSQPRIMTATALEDSSLLKIRSDDFYELLSDQEDITPAIFRAVVERVGRLVAE